MLLVQLRLSESLSEKGRTPCLLKIGLLRSRERAHFEMSILYLRAQDLCIRTCVQNNFIACPENRAIVVTSPLHGAEYIKIWATAFYVQI